MYIKVCIGCGDTLVGNNKKELKKMFKVHWDIQNPYFDKCKYCSIILHADNDDLVKTRLVEHEKFCEEANQHHSNHSSLYKKVCQGCGETFVGTNEEELNKRFWKVHWDDQNPFLEKCEYCSIIFHAETEDVVKKRLFEHESRCQFLYKNDIKSSQPKEIFNVDKEKDEEIDRVLEDETDDTDEWGDYIKEIKEG